jgi:competence protein ComEA
MINSLLLKLGMLSMTIGVVFWARWAPQPPVQDILSATAEQAVSFKATKRTNQETRAVDFSRQNVQRSDINAVARTEPSKMPIRSRLDLNRASIDELETLPGIGTVLAQRVIAFRDSVGGFQKIEDLREVKGIGAKKYDRLKALVTVSTENSRHETEQRES